ncbi:hypothetical protein DSL64_02745 [Dyadobacter luteus]|uniref:O-antigen polysaccharide polymerase Wzy n=1 Tax=Dyadobacter luteus TaxID=2259619 RepID=A0A3D8YI37_9BACT|nr:hypothetical protein [Dyadobacter luteus]REA64484.1 hypothetical protein DSL64_02745 [Dyadobacter luteus]
MTSSLNKKLDTTVSKQRFLSIFKSWSIRILILSSILELVLFPELPVLVGIAYSVIGWLIVYNIVLNEKTINNYPLSSLVVLGYGLCNFYLPMPATLLELKPITYNLTVPYSVFFHGIMSLSIVAISFRIYIHFANTKLVSPARRLLKYSGFYTSPDDLQIWLMGLVGIISLFVLYYAGIHTEEGESSSSKLIQGFFPFAYCPYFLFFKNLYSGTPKRRNNIYIFVAYSLIILLLAFMTNHRATFMKVVMGLCFTYLLSLLMNRISPDIFSGKKIAAYVIIVYLLTGPLVNLGLAMVTVRAQKKETSSIDMISKTIDVFFNEEALNQTRKKMEGVIVTNYLWDEHYVDNIFLARLCNLKASDLNLYHAERIDDSTPMREFLGNFVLALFPSPLLQILDITIDKKQIMKASYGDYLYYLSTGDYNGLESKRQSQVNGAGIAAFGYLYLLLLALVIIPVFYAVDLLSFRHDKRQFITVPALTIMPMLMTFFNYEGISTFLGFIIRGWIQMVVVYIILFRLTGFISKIFKI